MFAVKVAPLPSSIRRPLQDDLTTGRLVRCLYKGRRLDDASATTKQHTDDSLREATGWTDDCFDCKADLGTQCVGVVKIAVQSTHRKFQWCRDIPYAFAAIHRPNVAAECVRQYRAHSQSDHHPLSNLLLGPESTVAEEIRSIPVEGKPFEEFSADLKRSLGFMPLSPLTRFPTEFLCAGLC